MTRRCASTFPDHRFDFGECVYVSLLQEGGTINGIWRKQNDPTWRYSVANLTHLPDYWWMETDLEPACPRCLFRWQEPIGCSRCGLMPADLT